MKHIAMGIAVWAGCTFLCGLLLRVMWTIFMAGWGLL